MSISAIRSAFIAPLPSSHVGDRSAPGTSLSDINDSVITETLGAPQANQGARFTPPLIAPESNQALLAAQSIDQADDQAAAAPTSFPLTADEKIIEINDIEVITENHRFDTRIGVKFAQASE